MNARSTINICKHESMPRQVKLGQEEKFSDIQEYLCSPLIHSRTSDLTIYCENGAVPAHRLVLASLSKELGAILGENVTDKNISLILPDFCVEDVSKFMRKVYTGKELGEREELWEVFKNFSSKTHRKEKHRKELNKSPQESTIAKVEKVEHFSEKRSLNISHQEDNRDDQKVMDLYSDQNQRRERKALEFNFNSNLNNSGGEIYFDSSHQKERKEDENLASIEDFVSDDYALEFVEENVSSTIVDAEVDESDQPSTRTLIEKLKSLVGNSRPKKSNSKLDLEALHLPSI